MFAGQSSKHRAQSARDDGLSAEEYPSLTSFYPANDKPLVDHVAISHLRKSLPGHDGHSQLRNYEIHFEDRDSGEVIASEVQQRTVFKASDTADLLPYFISDSGDFVFLLTESVRAPVAARRHLEGGEEQSGLVVSLPGAYLRTWEGKNNISATVQFILAKKLGTVPFRDSETGEAYPLEYLGASTVPSGGQSSEAAFLCAQRVPAPQAFPAVSAYYSLGEGFDNRKLLCMSAPEILNAYLTRDFFDVRAVNAVLRFLEQRGESFTPNVLPLGQREIPEMGSIPSNTLSFSEVKELIEFPERSAVQTNTVTVKPIESGPQFLVKLLAGAQNQVSGLKRGEPFEAEVITRVRPDDKITPIATNTVDTLPIFQCGGKVYVSFLVRPQPNIAERNLSEHPLASDSNLLGLEPFSAYMELQDQTPEMTVQAISSAHGFRPTGTPVQIGICFPSPGFLTERVHSFISPSLPLESVLDENTIHVELGEALELSLQGYVRCPRTSAALQLLSHSLSYKRRNEPHQLDATPKERNELLELISKGSPLLSWMLEQAPEATVRYWKDERFRKIITYLENERGLLTLTPTNPDEARFFRAFVRVFAAFRSNSPEKWPARLYHDAEHMIMKDLSPFIFSGEGKVVRDKNGAPLVLSEAEWSKAVIESECVAVFRSDVELPTRTGIKEAALESWRGEIARSFERLGLSTESLAGELSEAQKAVLEIERDLRVPEEVLLHPAYEECRPHIKRLLRFGVLDRAQLRVFYRNWLESPEVAETALLFGSIHSSALQFLKAFSAGETEILSSEIFSTRKDINGYAEGSNPLRAEFSRTMNLGCEITAYRLAFFQSQVRHSAKPGYQQKYDELAERITALFAYHKTLGDIRNGVKGTEINQESIDAQRGLKALKRLIAEAQSFAEEVKQDRKFLSEEQVDLNRGRMFEPFRSQFAASSSFGAEPLQVKGVEIDLGDLTPSGSSLAVDLAVLRAESDSYNEAFADNPFDSELAEFEKLFVSSSEH
jgi:hypothetical protein